MILILFASVTAVYADDVDNSTLTSQDSAVEADANSQSIESNFTPLAANEDAVLSNEDEIPDVPDLNVGNKNYVYPSNIESYFKYGRLDSKYEGKTLIFSGTFENLGVLEVIRNRVTLIGYNATLKNTVFCIEANDVIVQGFNMDLNKNIRDNDGAAVIAAGIGISLIDLNISYVVPSDVEAYAIYADGINRYSSLDLKIINSTIYFEGHNDNVNKYNCAIKLVNVDGGLMENNTIITSLPLKNVKYGVHGATLDSDFVYSLGLEGCNDFIINNNVVIADANKRTAVLYPTLNCIMLSKSDNVVLSNNSVYMTDFVTYPGIESYIYGIDIYNLNNLTVTKNKVSIVSTGGKLALGTAYPIQICGPINGVKITDNDLYSFSNGPNIGIYSQNYFGDTELSITNNRINVTGLAGTHEWALVAGIESQDTYAEIINNTIEVHSVGIVNIGDNIYGISYRQSTEGTHTYEIRDNIAFSDGFYAVYLLRSDNSQIINNQLISYNPNAVSGSNSYAEGPGLHNGDTAYGNVVIRFIDYLNSQTNINVDPESNKNSQNYNNIHANQNSQSQSNNPRSNPLIPSYTPERGAISNPEHGDQSGLIDNWEDDGSSQGTIGDYSGANDNPNHGSTNNNNANKEKSQSKSNVDSSHFNTTDIKGTSGQAVLNSSEATPSLDGDGVTPLIKSQSSGSSDSQSVSKKAFEINEKEDEEFIPSIFFIIAALILLVVGFKRKNKNFN